MNVTELALTPEQYGRANYLKREIIALVRYGQQHATDAKKEDLAMFMAGAADYVAGELGVDLGAL